MIMEASERLNLISRHLATITSRNSSPTTTSDSSNTKMSKRSPITTHVLDTTNGCAASEIPIELFYLAGKSWSLFSEGYIILPVYHILYIGHIRLIFLLLF